MFGVGKTNKHLILRGILISIIFVSIYSIVSGTIWLSWLPHVILVDFSKPPDEETIDKFYKHWKTSWRLSLGPKLMLSLIVTMIGVVVVTDRIGISPQIGVGIAFMIYIPVLFYLIKYYEKNP